jgi:dihydroorotase
MPTSNRRAFLRQLGSAAVVLPRLQSRPLALAAEPTLPPSSAQAADSSVACDLLIAGGRVIDPSQKLSAERDVAILHGRIASVAPNIPRNQARHVFEAAGKIVTPGLIDLHTHIYEYGQIPLGVSSDRVGIQSGVTTVVDAGSTGATMFLGLRKFVIQGATTRIYALLNISSAGCCLDEIYLDPRLVDAKAARRVIDENRDLILGIKVRVRGKRTDVARDVAVMQTAREVADATGVAIMLHWTNEPEVLAILKRGDILTHPFNPPSPNWANLLGGEPAEADQVLPQILELRDRGIWTDGQAATTHTHWGVVERALGHGWLPDAISTDVARNPDKTPASVLLPMTAFLHLGLSLEQVIERVTVNPARMLHFPERIGTLQPGVTADVAILDLVQGHFELRDQSGQTRVARQQFVPVATVKSGIFVKGAAA